MRVIAGQWRGRKLSEPTGRAITRPTTDRVREACASMADSALAGGIEDARVLDAFAGSGAMGLEMLSRGAAHATFFDIDRTAAALVAKNLKAMGCAPSRYRVITGDVMLAAKHGSLPGAPFDLVLLDPPYACEAALIEELLAALSQQGALSLGSVVLYEHAAEKPGVSLTSFDILRQKRYGTTAVDVLCLASQKPAPASSVTGTTEGE